jgi:hypothetical protein
VEEAETAFLNKKEEQLEQAIEELSVIASSSPGNVLAAVNISKNFPEPLLAALMEKRDEVLRRFVKKNYFPIFILLQRRLP